MPIGLSTHDIREFWGQNFYRPRHSANLILLVTFYVFFETSFQKKRKKSCFFEIWKKHKIRILEHWLQRLDVRPFFFYHQSALPWPYGSFILYNVCIQCYIVMQTFQTSNINPAKVVEITHQMTSHTKCPVFIADSPSGGVQRSWVVVSPREDWKACTMPWKVVGGSSV